MQKSDTTAWLSVEGRTNLRNLHSHLTREMRKVTRKLEKSDAIVGVLCTLVESIPEPYYSELPRDASDPLSRYFDLIRQRWSDALRVSDAEKAKAEERMSQLFDLGIGLAQIEKEMHHALNPDER
jgi:hypothetical protein